MKLLALDQSSKVSGFAIFSDRALLKWGKFDFDDEVGIRLVKIREEVAKLIKDNDIDFVAFEDIQLQNSVGNNVQTFKVLAEVYGVIHEYLEENDIPYTIVSASRWKSKLGIKGKNRPEQKRAAQQYVLDTFNIEAIQDICDAICIGQSVIQDNTGAWS